MALAAVFAVSTVSAAEQAAKQDPKKCVASASGKKGAAVKACNKLKKAERKACTTKADEEFKAAKAACAA